MAYFTLMKWFSRESKTDNVVEDEEMIAEAKTLTRYNGAVFCIYVLRLALEEAGVVWSQLQEWKQHILLQLQWTHVSHTHMYIDLNYFTPRKNHQSPNTDILV